MKNIHFSFFLILLLLHPKIYPNDFNDNIQISSAKRHSCSLKKSFDVYCWGDNIHKQLGNKKGDSNIPVKVETISNASFIATGSQHSCAVLKTGKVHCWGLNSFGQLGVNIDPKNLEKYKSSEINLLENIISLALGDNHSCALNKTGEVFCWGDNREGQLGSKKIQESAQPTKVTALSKIMMITAGQNHSCALNTSGEVYCWGDNQSWQIGGNRIEDISPVTQVQGVRNVKQISAGGMTSCAVTVHGDVFCWGDNTSGQAGQLNTSEEQNSKIKIPLQIEIPKKIDSVTVGDIHTCALSVVKTVYCWGNNSTNNYQVGIVSLDPVFPIPTRVPNLINVKEVSAGGIHTCAITKEGEILCWGNNFQGQLGNGIFSKSSLRPTKVTLIKLNDRKNSLFYLSCHYYLLKKEILANEIDDYLIINSKSAFDWGIISNATPNDYIVLDGHVEDGFFVESKLTYDKILESCNNIIQLRNKSLKSGDTYKLYEFKANFSDDDEKEFPISFFNPMNMEKIKRIVVFGDSLSDTGNLKNFTHIFPGKPYFKGRFSNGFNWTDYFNFITNIPILNYAYGGAKSKAENNVSPSKIISFIKSNIKNLITGGMTGYIDEYSSSKIKWNPNFLSTSVDAYQETLFVIWIGGNDYLDAISSKDGVLKLLNDNEFKVAKTVTENIFHGIDELQKHGAKNILVIGVPNIAITPEIILNKNIISNEELLKNKDAFFLKVSNIIKKNNEIIKGRIDVNTLMSRHKIHFLDINPF